jgi:hypothetical protein
MSGSCSIWCRRAFKSLARRPFIAILIAHSVLSASHARAQSLCFEVAVNYGVGASPKSVVAADLDGDGDQDLAVANWGSNDVSVLKNNGDGTYAPAASYVTGQFAASVFAADLDGDGDQDLVVANGGPDNVSVLKNNGDGSFASAVNYAVGASPKSVVAADLDGDGDQDLASANYMSDNVSILKNNGDGTFASAGSYPVGTRPNSIVAADLDGDGDKDLAVANDVSSNVSVLKNNGDGTFASAVPYTADGPARSVVAADLDGDGDQDLVVAIFAIDNSVVVLKNNGDGTFAPAVKYTAGNGSWSVVAADLDGDGDQDLAVGNYYSSDVWLLENNGNGTFVSVVGCPVDSVPWSVVAADLDGDGDQDLAAADNATSKVSVLKNCLLPIVVTTLDNSGVGSLRSAIETANTHSGPDTITFTVAGVISPSSPLPPLSDPTGGTVILGFTAPGASAPFTPTVILDGTSSAPGPGLLVNSSNNRIEGLALRNFRDSAGVEVIYASSVANTITGCQFYGANRLGIDLGGDGVTPNDPGDADTGPNDLLNFPVFDSTAEIGTDTFTVYGTSAPKSRVELYLAARWGDSAFQPEVTTHGPAYRLLGSTTASVSGFFSIGPVAEPMWSLVTATATDTLGNTSEFSDNWLLVPAPLRITAYSELVTPLHQPMSMPLGSPAMQVVVISPPDALGKIDTIGPPPTWPNTFEARATYDSLTDYDSGGKVDTRVKIASPDTGEYKIKYVLIGDPGSYLTGIGIDGHAEVKNQIAFADKKQIAFVVMGQVVDTTYHLAPPTRGELNGDGVIDVFDVIASIDMIFSGAPMPEPQELVNVNCDGVPDVFDVIYLIDYVFSGGPDPCR